MKLCFRILKAAGWEEFVQTEIDQNSVLTGDWKPGVTHFSFDLNRVFRITGAGWEGFRYVIHVREERP
jgi:hypothetical protein